MPHLHLIPSYTLSFPVTNALTLCIQLSKTMLIITFSIHLCSLNMFSLTLLRSFLLQKAAPQAFCKHCKSNYNLWNKLLLSCYPEELHKRINWSPLKYNNGWKSHQTIKEGFLTAKRRAGHERRSHSEQWGWGPGREAEGHWPGVEPTSEAILKLLKKYAFNKTEEDWIMRLEAAIVNLKKCQRKVAIC